VRSGWRAANTGLPASGRAWFYRPGRDCLGAEPHGQAPALTQAGVIGGPVRHRVPLARNMTMAILVELEGRASGVSKGSAVLPSPALRRHNNLVRAPRWRRASPGRLGPAPATDRNIRARIVRFRRSRPQAISVGGVRRAASKTSREKRRGAFIETRDACCRHLAADPPSRPEQGRPTAPIGRKRLSALRPTSRPFFPETASGSEAAPGAAPPAQPSPGVLARQNDLQHSSCRPRRRRAL